MTHVDAPALRRLSRLGSVVVALVALGSVACSGMDGCSKRPEEAGEDAAPLDPSHAEARPDEPRLRLSDGGKLVDAGRAADDAIDPACTGSALKLVDVIGEPRCAIGPSRVEAMIADLKKHHARELTSLRQTASLAEDATVRVRVVNGGSVPLALPVSVRSDWPAFAAFADDARRGEVFELVAPRLVSPAIDGGADAGDGGDAAADARPRPSFARVLLPPGGSIEASADVSPAVVRRLRPPCKDAGTCAPPTLPKGRYTLNVGQLVIDVETGDPARIAWEVKEVVR